MKRLLLLVMSVILVIGCSNNKNTVEYKGDNSKVGFTKKDGEFDSLTENKNTFDISKLAFGNETSKKIKPEEIKIKSGNSKQDRDENLN